MSQKKTDAQTHAHTNRLAGEKSPYLLQHQHNPVDWYPWGAEAFERARELNRPIFLSIGYSTCHWCHVMERESFENEETAAYLNEHFVSIKIDREERPDVDKIYMTYVQATTGQGGWPLNVFLTPDRKPFYGGTYWPPESKFGRPSFRDVLEKIQSEWTARHADIVAFADQMRERLVDHTRQSAAESGELTQNLLDAAAEKFKSEYDPKHGGFGGAPKFPRPSQPSFLLQWAVENRDEEAVRMILHTCDRMAAGGMYDQLGGGFARYAVDAKWLIPHFEKMLYDNAQLIHLYLDAYLVSGETRHAEVVRDVIRYVARDMTHPEGGFFSAEDADSEGKEGKFYTWTTRDLTELLTGDEMTVVTRHFGITEQGNFVDHSDPNPLLKQNVLYIADPDLSDSDRAVLERAKAKMLAARDQRIRPHLDDKILSSWNGLMIGAMARAGAVLGEPEYGANAEKATEFIRQRLWDNASGTLYHRWRDGERDTVQLLDAYAYLLSGVVDLYETTLKIEHLQFALALADGMINRFFDVDNAGFWQSMGTDDLIMRIKEDYDGALPSANSVAILALLKLGAITDQDEYKRTAERSLKLFAEQLERLPQAVPYMLSALDYLLTEPRRVVIAGEAQSAASQSLLRAAHGVYQPNKVVLSNTGPVEPFAKTLPADGENGPLVYLCTGTSCLPPTADPDEVQVALKRR